MSVTGSAHTGRGDAEGISAKIWEAQVAQQHAAVGVRICAHAPFTGGYELRKLGYEAARVVEEFSRPVAFQPAFKQRQVRGICCRNGQRHLMGAERSLNLHAINDLDRKS